MQLMENRFFNAFRRLVGRQNNVEDAPAVDPARLPDFLRGRVSADGFRQAFGRFNDLEQDTRQLANQSAGLGTNKAICYLTADGAVFGLIGSSFRVRTRKHSRALRADDMADADEVG